MGQEYNPNMPLPELSMGMMPFASSMAGLAPPPPPVFDGSPSVEPMMMNYSNQCCHKPLSIVVLLHLRKEDKAYPLSIPDHVQ